MGKSRRAAKRDHTWIKPHPLPPDDRWREYTLDDALDDSDCDSPGTQPQ